MIEEEMANYVAGLLASRGFTMEARVWPPNDNVPAQVRAFIEKLRVWDVFRGSRQVASLDFFADLIEVGWERPMLDGRVASMSLPFYLESPRAFEELVEKIEELARQSV